MQKGRGDDGGRRRPAVSAQTAAAARQRLPAAPAPEPAGRTGRRRPEGTVRRRGMCHLKLDDDDALYILYNSVIPAASP